MFRKILAVAAALFFCSGLALGQSTFGTLVGVVTDPTGAMIPKAAVTATHVATNTSKSTSTDSFGSYELPNLPPGTYRVSVKAAGFEELVQQNIPLDPRATVRVNAVLQVGSAQTVVEVKGAPPVVTTETGTVSDIETSQQVSQLPINQRAIDTSPFAIITTIPGVAVDSRGTSSGTDVSIGGAHTSMTEYSVDGFSVDTVRNAGALPEMYPSTEAISEVKATTEVASAEYGAMSDVAFVTKGGSNHFHGSLFEYLQNDALDAIPAFATHKPKVRDNDFGGSIGGPVILPHYNGKDRTFFFFDWESNRQHSAAAITQNVPTTAMRNGDFSSLLPGTQLYNPLTGTAFVNNQIPVNPTSAAILNTFYPVANTQQAGALNTTNNLTANYAAPVTANLFDVRIDRNITKKQSIFGRISWKNLVADSPMGLNLGPQAVSTQPRTYVLSHNYAFTSGLLNEARFAYSHQIKLTSYPQFPDGATLVTQTLGLQQLPAPFPKGSAIPGLSFSGSSGITSISGRRQEPLKEGTIQVADNLTWLRGRHTLKFGFDVRAYRLGDYSNFDGADNFGNFYFNGAFTGSDIADFLLGLPNQTQVVAAGADYIGRAKSYGFFGQDSFRVSPKFTINFGVRYEYHPPFHDETYQITQFDPATGGFIVPDEGAKLTTLAFEEGVNACGLSTPVPTPYGLYPCTPMELASKVGIPQALRFGDKTKILPRLSLAYRLSDKTVVRGGAGLYDAMMKGAIFNALTSISSSNYQAFNNSITAGAATIQFPNTESNNPSTGVSAAGSEEFGTATDIHLRDPYDEQWSLTVERDLGRQTGLRVTYNGMRSVGLVVSPDLNEIQPQTTPWTPTEKPYPNWGQIETLTNGASAIYNAMETSVTHRFSAGLFVQSTWTWAKNLSDGEGDVLNNNFQSEYGGRVINHFDLPANYGNVAFTRRHRWLTTAVFDIPVGRGMKYGSSMNSVLDGIVGGWRTSNIIVLETGPYITPQYGGSLDPSGTDAPGRQGQQRPDLLPASACSGMDQSGEKLYDGSCLFYGWPATPIGRFGNAGFGIFGGPGTAVWNFGLSKNFRLTEALKLRFECTSTNILNHVNYAIPNMTVNSSAFGTISGVQTAEGTGARNVQFALRLDF